MYRYFQRSETDAWTVLPVKNGEDPVPLALSHGARKLTILSVSAMVQDGDDPDQPRNRDTLSYRGPLYFDIDCKEDIAWALRSANELVDRLLSIGTPEGGIEVFLSGSKGVHVLVNEALFSSGRFTRRLPEIYKEMARDLFVSGLDFSVYCSGRGNSFRIPGVRREDGNYRVPVTITELKSITPEHYRVLVSEPRQIVKPVLPQVQVPELMALFEEAKKRVNTKQKVVLIATSTELEKVRYEPPACIQMLCDGKNLKGETNFNQLATQLACYIVRAGVDPLVADALAARAADNNKSSKFSTAKLRRDHIEAQIRYMEHTPGFSFGCNAIRALLAKRPCDGCVIEASGGEDGAEDGDISAEAQADGYYVRYGESMRRITNFTLLPSDVYIEKPQDGTSARRAGTKMLILQDGVEVGTLIVRESSFAGRSSFLREVEGVKNLTFQGTDLDVQKIKMAVFREDQDMGEVFQVYTAGVHLDFIGDVPVFTYVEPDLSINSVKVQGTHQFLGNLQARPYFAKTTVCPRGDADADTAVEALLGINKPYEIGMIVGWCVACHYREHLQHLYNQFPVLSLWGSSGAGKSITAGIVTWLNGTDYMSQDSGANAPSATPWTMIEYCSSTTTVPRIIEEYNKSKMSQGAYRDTGERIKQSWGRESTMRGRPSSKGMGRGGGETVSFPMSSPLIVMSEQEIEMPAIQERSIRVQLTKQGRNGRRPQLETARRLRHSLRQVGKGIMVDALNTTLEDAEELMERASAVLPEMMDDRPRYCLQTALFGLWKFHEVLENLQLPRALAALDKVIAEVMRIIKRQREDTEGDFLTTYVQSEIDLVVSKMAMIIAISRSAEASGAGRVYMREGHQYNVNSQYLVLDPVMAYASYTSYTAMEERSTPVIASPTQFLKLIREEPYFAGLRQFAGMGSGREMLFLDIAQMTLKAIDVNLFLEVPDGNANFG